LISSLYEFRYRQVIMTAMQGAGIYMNDVHKSYGNRPALRGLSVNIPAGERYALIGPNGAGKSTTLKLLVGLLKPDAGDIRVMGIRAKQH